MISKNIASSFIKEVKKSLYDLHVQSYDLWRVSQVKSYKNFDVCKIRLREALKKNLRTLRALS